MRDPLRIIRICALLEIYWRKNPDLRLAQIVGNFTPDRLRPVKNYYLEDDVVERALRDALTEECP